MSVNRENVTWQSEDGTWSRGFFEHYDVETEKDDWDFEWDVEYDHSAFIWASGGHPTAEAANASWEGASPGYSLTVPWEGHEAECASYDAMAAKLKEAG